MFGTLSEEGQDLLLRAARTHRAWQPRPVGDELLRQVHALAALGPTSTNCQPLRVVLVRTPEAKARLLPCLSPGNVEKTRAAPVTAIFAHDMEFYELMPRLFPTADMRATYAGKPDLIASTAFRNGSLQAAYFMLAARALGLDCGGMSGFDNARVDAEFFADGRWKSNFLCNLGYGDPAKLAPRLPRLDFDEVARLI